MTERTDGSNLCNTCKKPINFRKDEETDKWLRFNPDGTPHTHAGGGGGPRGKTPQELRDIRRSVVLKCATDYAVSRTDMKTADLFKLADAMIAWVEK